eukprot:TRINITY_DN6013_c0_g1_i4.p1 TRINITY_DN6013_c0_g1~~TRINITY_DN6013_c0_g1_i4.p1  ORF type:complete len:414 (+),score=142.33 TRINITY_DN6013_c0_g1_i4:1224-2465(+)
MCEVKYMRQIFEAVDDREGEESSVKDVIIHRHNIGNRASGFVTVVFTTAEAAHAAVKLNGMDVGGRAMYTKLVAPAARPFRPPSRYFLEPDGKESAPKGSSKVCIKCRQTGHFAKDCTAEASDILCGICAEKGHDKRDCPLDAVCRTCFTYGHKAHSCRNNENISTMLCFRCLLRGCGGDAAPCSNGRNARGLDLTLRAVIKEPPPVNAEGKPVYGPMPGTEKLRCITCGQVGHVRCGGVDADTLQQLRPYASCYGCGEMGHPNTECSALWPRGEHRSAQSAGRRSTSQQQRLQRRQSAPADLPRANSHIVFTESGAAAPAPPPHYRGGFPGGVGAFSDDFGGGMSRHSSGASLALLPPHQPGFDFAHAPPMGYGAPAFRRDSGGGGGGGGGGGYGGGRSSYESYRGDSYRRR